MRATFLALILLTSTGLLHAAEVMPDMSALARAAKDYEDGFYGDALFQLKKAASYGNTSAHLNIGMMYAGGLGVDEDDVEACAWLLLAAVRGEDYMLQSRNEVCAPLTDAQQLDARRRAKKLNHDYGDHAALKNRRLWARDRRMELTGSRTGSVGNVRAWENTDTTNTKSASETGYNIYGGVEEYVTEMEEIVTRVEYGELELVDN